MQKLILLLALLPALLLAHPGGLDSNGGHTDSKTGQYHTHRQPAAAGTASSQAAQSSQSSKSWETGSPQLSGSKATYTSAEIEERIGLYFRIANMGVSVSSPVTVQERNVSEETKASVIRRDGGKCITCSSTVQLEVDHRVALMNGGTNDLSNLATLCDACHLAKTRMDGSLRRQREKNLGK